MSRSARVDYDKIAHLWDSQPYRGKSLDAQFAAFVEECLSAAPIRALDIACGTGSQLIANRAAAPDAGMVGADTSIGMLREGRRKAPAISWVQADAAALPFGSGSFDYVGCQFAFHHFHDKPGMLGEGLRLLRRGGRLVLRNMCPQECADWLCYEYFPAAWTADLRDFWPIAELTAAMEQAGFAEVTAEYEHIRFDTNLADWLDHVRRRYTCSQLQTIPDADYAAGLRRLENELADPAGPRVRADHLCLVTIRADKP
ncbi:MAG TPA: methyltransferase domain-containing protein [Stellaceae bacterium]